MNGFHILKPSLIIVGTQKSGTSGLFYSLNQHPQLIASRKKEIYYFCDDTLYEPIEHRAYNKNFRSRIPPPENLISYEATPEYSYHSECANRIYQYNPSMKILFLVRDPVSRAFAAWQMYHNFKDDPVYYHSYDERTFSEAISEEIQTIESTTWYTNPIAYIKRGHYSEQLKRYLAVFPEKNVLVLEQDGLIHNWESTVYNIEQFLGVDKAKLPFKRVNTTSYSSPMPLEKEQYKDLINIFHPWNTELFSMLGRSFQWQ